MGFDLFKFKEGVTAGPWEESLKALEAKTGRPYYKNYVGFKAQAAAAVIKEINNAGHQETWETIYEDLSERTGWRAK
jgi:hypothetical protein